MTLTPLSRATLLELANTRVQACFKHASETLGRTFKLPDVTLTQRGKVAGAAHLQRNQIRLNPVLFGDNQEVFITQVIPHEVCHILAYQMFGRVKPHGEQWQTLMEQVFSIPAEVRHNLDTRKVSGKTYDYRCGCGVIPLSIRRHNKVVRGKQKYSCRTCNEILLPAWKT